MSMQRAIASAVWFTLAAHAQVAAQTSAQVVTASGLHTVIFDLPQGEVRIEVAADAAPGDTLTGVVRADARGARGPAERGNLADLSGLVVDSPAGTSRVSDGGYRWVIPASLRTGLFLLTLRDADGTAVAQTALPIDAVPAPATPPRSGDDAFELPRDAQAGQPTVIRGPFAGTFSRVEVSVGGSRADLIAASPRRLVFDTPSRQVGEVPLRVTSGNRSRAGTVRVMAVRLTATATELTRGQRATLTAMVMGLRNLDAPATLTFRNLSPEILSLQGGDAQTMAIQPRQVLADGTATVTRTLTGVRPGPFRLTATAARSPLTRFDVMTAAGQVLTTWEGATRIRISPTARDLIQRSVQDARDPLGRFLLAQQEHQADVRDVFAALLSHYCFDLRDGQPGNRIAGSGGPAPPPALRLVTVAQPAGQEPLSDIDAPDVRRLSFREFLSRLVARFSGSQAAGYLFVSSTPPSAAITIDGQRKGEMTNRRFVTSIGSHEVAILLPTRTCRQQVRVDAFQTSVITCTP